MSRRHPRRDQNAARSRHHRRRLHDRHRQNPAENVKDLPGLTPAGISIRFDADQATGHIQILQGNLAPEGAVAKITGKEGLRFSVPPRSSTPKKTCSPPSNDSEIRRATSS